MDGSVESRVRYPEQRQAEILRLLGAQRQVEVSRLADSFSVTTETIRRDLSELQRQRLVRRVHGGAIPWETGRVNPQLAERETEQSDEKDRIARLAVQELPPEGEVLLDSGTTTARVARQLPRTSSLTIVTNSLANVEALAGHEHVRLVVLGGELERNTATMVDAETVTAIAQLTVDTLVLGTDGISPERGLTTPFRRHAAVKSTMIASARRVVVLADHTKVGTDQFVRFAGCGDIDTVITDSAADDDVLAAIEAQGPTVLRA